MRKIQVLSASALIQFCLAALLQPLSGQPADQDKGVTFDCVKGACREIIVPGDAYQDNPDFFGYADPSIRKDPVADTIWFSYSYPHYKKIDSTFVPSVAIHLARSGDGGETWSFVKKLFEPVPMNNPADPGKPGFLDHETINLLPVTREGRTFWCAARLNYFIPRTGGFAARPNNSFHITIVKAENPESLTSSETGIIGGNLTHRNWNAGAVLVPPDLSREVFFWNEPALYYDDRGDRLYLIMVAFVYRGGKPLMSKNDVYVYSTTPGGGPASWRWAYQGKLADSSTAAELGGERVTQTDVALGTDGKLLLICTPDDWNAAGGDFNHKGCRVVEIKSLDKPELERDGAGRLRVRAAVIAGDANEFGSGASAYDRHSKTGLLFTKREKTAKKLTANIWATGLKP